jgi:hypothetical protein
MACVPYEFLAEALSCVIIVITYSASGRAGDGNFFPTSNHFRAQMRALLLGSRAHYVSLFILNKRAASRDRVRQLALADRQ